MKIKNIHLLLASLLFGNGIAIESLNSKSYMTNPQDYLEGTMKNFDHKDEDNTSFKDIEKMVFKEWFEKIFKEISSKNTIKNKIYLYCSKKNDINITTETQKSEKFGSLLFFSIKNKTEKIIIRITCDTFNIYKKIDDYDISDSLSDSKTMVTTTDSMVNIYESFQDIMLNLKKRILKDKKEEKKDNYLIENLYNFLEKCFINIKQDINQKIRYDKEHKISLLKRDELIYFLRKFIECTNDIINHEIIVFNMFEKKNQNSFSKFMNPGKRILYKYEDSHTEITFKKTSKSHDIICRISIKNLEVLVEINKKYSLYISMSKNKKKIDINSKEAEDVTNTLKTKLTEIQKSDKDYFLENLIKQIIDILSIKDRHDPQGKWFSLLSYSLFLENIFENIFPISLKNEEIESKGEQMESKVEVSQISSLLKEQPSESLQLQSIPKRSKSQTQLLNENEQMESKVEVSEIT
jgi:hypothetical protein